MIRRAIEADAAAIAALSIEVWLSTYIKNGITRVFAQYVLAEFELGRVGAVIAAPSEHIWVFDVSEGIAGYIRATDDRSAPVHGGGTMEITTLYVQPRHQGRGIGAQLLRHLVANTDATPWLKVNSENTKAIGFYNTQGFSKVGVTAFELDGAAYANDVMTLTSRG